MDRTKSDRLLLVCAGLALVAAAAVVVSMFAPTTDSTFLSIVGGARFVAAVFAGVLGFIAWFERRFPVEDDVIDLRDGVRDRDEVAGRT